jgi:MscS family membrane protein
MDDLLERAERCFNLSQIPLERRDDVAEETIALLSEIFDRIDLPPLAKIPDVTQVIQDQLTSWRIPYTEIKIAKVTEDGPRQGEWLFSPRTISQMKSFYEKIKDRPYKPDAIFGKLAELGGLYDHLLFYPEFDSFIPHAWIDDMPAWLLITFFDHALWKWLASLLVIIAGIALFMMICRLCRRHQSKGPGDSLLQQWPLLLPPLSGLLIALLIDHMVDEEIGLTGISLIAIEILTWAAALLSLSWGVMALGRILAEILIGSHGVKKRRIDPNLIRISSRILSGLVALWILVEGADRFGLSVVPLLAGLGIGGLAIALAVRPTLENVIGGFILFADRPVRRNDRCRFDGQEGYIEEIGLRSTRVRTREDTLVSIPNAEFSQLRLENLTRRTQTLFHTTIGLRYETTAEQMRYVLARLREMLLGHPMVSPDRLRARFTRFNAYSLDIEIKAFVRTQDWQEYHGICEDLNLHIMDIVKEAGTSFAFPSQTTYLTRDEKLDPASVQAAEKQVENWRSEGRLPFPEFDEKQSQELEDVLSYPPEGSPHYRPAAGTSSRRYRDKK